MVSYFVFMILAMLAAWAVSQFTPPSTPEKSQQLFVMSAAFIGAFLAAKVPFWILAPEQLHNAGSFLFSGKTVLFGLVGGYAAVELAKWRLRIRVSTGDGFVVPVATAIGVGRLGCFFTGCCYGLPTNAPWGVVFSSVDSIARHPTQIYESAFHLLMAALTFWLLRKKIFQCQLIKFYFLSYFAFRFCTEFIRPEIKWSYGLTGYQWAIVVLAPVFVALWIRDANSQLQPGYRVVEGS